jgi:biotin carboxyl carrier protein
MSETKVERVGVRVDKELMPQVQAYAAFKGYSVPEALDALLRTAFSRRAALDKYATYTSKVAAQEARAAKKAEREAKKAEKAAAKAKPAPKAPKASKPAKHAGVLPPVGGTLTRSFKGEDHVVTVLENGFGYNGAEYSSLSRTAAAIAGRKCSGTEFFGLAK